MNRKAGNLKNSRDGLGRSTQRAVDLARADLACFATLMHRRFDIAPLHRLLIEKLERVERGDIDRLMIFTPPRRGKSLLSSELFPAWYLGRHPDRSIIASSYGAELATDFGRKVRNHMADRVYRAVFPRAAVSGDSTAAHRFNLAAGDAYYAVGAGGPLTGRGADLLLVDDPIKNAEDAASSAFPQRFTRMVSARRIHPPTARRGDRNDQHAMASRRLVRLGFARTYV